jgi:hypothetical protein
MLVKVRQEAVVDSRAHLEGTLPMLAVATRAEAYQPWVVVLGKACVSVEGRMGAETCAMEVLEVHGGVSAVVHREVAANFRFVRASCEGWQHRRYCSTRAPGRAHMTVEGV